MACIDHRGCHGLAVDQRTAARGPGAVGVKLELIGTGVAKEFHGVAAFDEAGALAQQAFEFHRADFGTRSEEHTSELQSLMRISYAVFCLKKKTNTQTTETKVSENYSL